MIGVGADGYRNRLGEISFDIFPDMGPPGEEYSCLGRLPSDVSQRLEKFWNLLRQTFIHGVETDENPG